MSGRISIVIALVMAFVGVMLSCSKKSEAQTTPQTPGMYMEEKVNIGGYHMKKMRDPSTGVVCYFISSDSISCLK